VGELAIEFNGRIHLQGVTLALALSNFRNTIPLMLTPGRQNSDPRKLLATSPVRPFNFFAM
jgi:hypothetical protein